MTYKKDRLDNFNSIEFVKDIERKYGKTGGFQRG